MTLGSLCNLFTSPSLMDILHLVRVVRDARKIDQTKLWSFAANYSKVQGLQGVCKGPVSHRSLRTILEHITNCLRISSMCLYVNVSVACACAFAYPLILTTEAIGKPDAQFLVKV